MGQLPDVNVTVQDGGLGAIPGSTDKVRALIGYSSLGDANRVYAFTSKKKLLETLGFGPLVEAAAHSLEIAGGPIYCVPVDAGVAAETTDVEQTDAGPVVSIAGDPVDDFDVLITITKAGVRGTARFTVSFDGGLTTSKEYVVPTGGTYELADSGITATFAAGTYIVDEEYSFRATAPKYDSSAFNDAFDALLADPRTWSFVHAVGIAQTAAAAAAIASAMATKLAAAETAHRYAFGIVDAVGVIGIDGSGEPVEYDDDTASAALQSAFASVADSRLYVAAGPQILVSAVTGYQQVRPVGWSHAARIAAIQIHEDTGRFIDGPLKGVIELLHDEGISTGLDDTGFATSRTYVGEAGFYATRGKMKAPSASDFQTVDRRRVIDRACTVARAGLMRYLNDTVLVDAETGFIDPTAADRIEKRIRSLLYTDLVAAGHASGVVVQVPRDENILSSETLSCTIRVVPLAKTTYIEATIGLDNPALSAG